VKRHPRTITRLDMTVNAVVTDVELATEEPLGIRRIPLLELSERLEPRHPLTRLGLPELIRIPLENLRTRVRVPGELLRRRIRPLLLEQGRDICRLAHPHSSLTSGSPAVGVFRGRNTPTAGTCTLIIEGISRPKYPRSVTHAPLTGRAGSAPSHRPAARFGRWFR